MTPHPPRRRGRPAIVEGMPSIEVSVSIPENHLREILAIAHAERVKEQEIIRLAVGKFLRDRTRAARRARLPQRVVVTGRRLGI